MPSTQTNYVLVGPSAERFKGGISQFTSHLAENLSEKTQLSFFSWYQPYPAFLTSRDFVDNVSKNTTGTTKANFLLGYMNPLSWWQFIKAVKDAKTNTVCFTWIHPVQAPVYAILTLLTKKLTKAEVIFICHNVLPHESFKGDRFLTWIGLLGADKLIVHSVSEQKQALSLFKNKTITRLFLPLHNFFTDDGSIKNTADKDNLNILFFGTIRHYKGLDILIKAMAIVVKKVPNVRLRIVGEKFFKTNDTDEASNPTQLIESLGLTSVVNTDFRYIANEEIPGIFAQADVAVFPYRSATQSGPITVAYSYNVPVISTRVGGIPDVVADGISGYLVEPNSEQALAESILKYIDNPISKSNVESVAKMLSWENYTHSLLNHIDFEIPEKH